MIRVNTILCCVLLACALALVTSQHRSRALFAELTREQEVAKQIEVEWGQLQLEQSTWAMHARVEKIASGYLQMRVPSPDRVRVLGPGAQSTAVPRRNIP